MSGCESEKDRVMSQFPLYSSLPCFCPRAAFHPHYRNSDGTFLPPPLLVFSFSLHVLFLSRFLPLFAPFVSRTLFVCHSWTLPSSFWHFFSLFNSVLHPTLTLFFWYRAHLKKKKRFSVSVCVCVCINHLPPSQQNSEIVYENLESPLSMECRHSTSVKAFSSKVTSRWKKHHYVIQKGGI